MLTLGAGPCVQLTENHLIPTPEVLQEAIRQREQVGRFAIKDKSFRMARFEPIITWRPGDLSLMDQIVMQTDTYTALGSGLHGTAWLQPDGTVFKVTQTMDGTADYLLWASLRLKKFGRGSPEMYAIPAVEHFERFGKGYFVVMPKYEKWVGGNMWGTKDLLRDIPGDIQLRGTLWLIDEVFGEDFATDLHPGNVMMDGAMPIILDPSSDGSTGRSYDYSVSAPRISASTALALIPGEVAHRVRRENKRPSREWRDAQRAIEDVKKIGDWVPPFINVSAVERAVRFYGANDWKLNVPVPKTRAVRRKADWMIPQLQRQVHMVVNQGV